MKLMIWFSCAYYGVMLSLDIDSQDISVGEIIMSVPCSVRIDVNTIMADPVIGPAIKSLAIELIKDEELVMGLYFMR